MKKTIFILIISYLKFFHLNSQISFEKFYANEYESKASTIKHTLDSGYILIGSSNSYFQNTEIYVLKLDKFGDIQWSKLYGGSQVDIGKDIIQNEDSSYTFVGYTNSNTPNNSYQAIIYKINPHGDIIWETQVGGTNWDFAYGIVHSQDSGYLITGETYSFGNGDNDGYVIKINPNGDIAWEKTFGGTNQDKFNDIIQSQNTGYILAGESNSNIDSNRQAYIVEIDSGGNLVWEYFYGDSLEEYANSIKKLPDGYAFTGANSSHTGGTDFDMWNVKIQFNGLIIWDFYIDNYAPPGCAPEQDGIGNAIGLKGMQNELIFGGTRSYCDNYLSNAFLYETTNSPNFSFNQNLTYHLFNGGSYDEIISIDSTSDGGYIVACNIQNYDASTIPSILLIKIDTSGNYPLEVYPTISYIYDSTTSIQEESNDFYVTIYPNPATNKVNINSPSKSKLIILNNIGELISKKMILGGNNTIDISHFKKGVYFFQLENIASGKTMSHKICVY